MIEELGWKIIYDILNWDTQKAFVLLYFLLSIYKILLNKNRKIDHLHHQNFNSILRNSKEKLRLKKRVFRKGWRAKSRKISKRESFDKSYRDKSWKNDSKYKSAFVTRQRSQQLDNGTEDVTFCIANSTWNPTVVFPWKYARTTALPSLFSI